MKFAEIIRNAGLNPKDFEKASNIPTTLYDGKNRTSSEETVTFVKPLFEENEGSLKNFNNFLIGLEKEEIESLNVRVDIDSVILFHQTPRAIVFLRHPSMDPMDYMA